MLKLQLTVSNKATPVNLGTKYELSFLRIGRQKDHIGTGARPATAASRRFARRGQDHRRRTRGVQERGHDARQPVGSEVSRRQHPSGT